jgi:hypothetical protein
MAKFQGKVGYGELVETTAGVWEEEITERSYFGDVLRDTRRLREGEKVNDDITVGNMFSIVADAYANEHFHAIRYVEWAGTLWKVSEVEVQRPRLLLRLGGVYNGPKVAAPGGL